MGILPLAGIRVLDLSRLLPGPYCTLVLADLGADVVKVEEPPGGDYLRWMPPLAGEQSGYFHALNRNKRSLLLDLKKAEGAAALRRVARRFDVLVESFRPGVLEKLGLGFDELREENRGIVFCSITGYGQDGPYRERAGHDLDYCALTGVLGLNGPPDAPLPLGVQVADVAGGAWPAVTGILAALVRRTATGEGARVDISMAEGALAMMAMALGGAAARGQPLRRGRELLNGGAACYGVYRTLDGRFVALAALEPKFFGQFCAALGRPELVDRQFEDGGGGPRAELETVFAARTREEWAHFAAKHDVCLMPVLEGDEPASDPHLRSRGAFFEVETPWEGKSIRAVATPVRLAGVEPLHGPAPELGADTDAVLGEAGFTSEEIAKLREAGAT
jgi:alpha-methylacyl-CoA racemase